MPQKKTVILLDLDGTITAEETLPAIARKLNLDDEIIEMTKETVAGNIPFVESFITRVNLLGKHPVKVISEVIYNIPLHKHLVQFVKENKNTCHIVTGNLDCWVGKLLKDIGCGYYCSKAVTAEGRVKKISSIINKAAVVDDFNEAGYRTVFVGEGNNDAEAMRCADISIAFGAVHFPSNSSLDFSTHVIFNEDTLCRFLKQLL